MTDDAVTDNNFENKFISLTPKIEHNGRQIKSTERRRQRYDFPGYVDRREALERVTGKSLSGGQDRSSFNQLLAQASERLEAFQRYKGVEGSIALKEYRPLR